MSWLESLSQYLNTNNGTLTAIATVVLAGITFWYALMTQKTVRGINRPEILIFLSPDPSVRFINLCIQNTGTGYASDIKFAFGGAFSYIPILSGKPFSAIGIFREGFDYLLPGKNFELPLCTIQNVESLPQQTLTFTVTYKDSVQKKYKTSFSLNLTQWTGLSEINEIRRYYSRLR